MRSIRAENSLQSERARVSDGWLRSVFMNNSSEESNDPASSEANGLLYTNEIGQADGKLERRAPIISYLRVFPSDAIAGIEPLQEAIANSVKALDFEIVAEFIEVGAAGDADDLRLRPVLGRALDRSRELNCPIAVPELERLGRDHSFVAKLVATPARFIVTGLQSCFQPFVMSAYSFETMQDAEIVRRDRKKRRLHHNMTDMARQLRAARVKAQADQFAAKMFPLIQPLRAQGLSLAKIAAIFDRRGVPTAKGGAWASGQIRAIILRMEMLDESREMQTFTPVPLPDKVDMNFKTGG
jgi:hypothetical protein